MKNKVIAIVLAAALTTGIGAGFIYTQHVNKNMVHNNVVATEQNAANDSTESKVETVKESKKAAPVETKKADVKADKTSAKKAVETQKAAAKADDKKQNTQKAEATKKAEVKKQSTQKAEATKKAEVKTSAKSEKTADHVQKVAATKKAEVKAADAKKAEVKAADTKKADKDMSEAEWNKIVDQRMRERYEESLRHADDVQDTDEDKYINNETPDPGQVVSEEALHANDVVDEDHMTEEEWNKEVERRFAQRCEESMRHANDRPDTESTTETDIEIPSDAE